MTDRHPCLRILWGKAYARTAAGALQWWPRTSRVLPLAKSIAEGSRARSRPRCPIMTRLIL